MSDPDTRPALMAALLTDLDAETTALRAAVEGADDDAWRAPTPAAGWSVATQVAHLVWTDEAATLAAGAVTDGAAGKAAWDELVLGAMADPAGFVDDGAHALAVLDRDELFHRWEVAGAGLRNSLRAVGATGERMPWFGPPMSAASMATARFMETWAHALDVYEALGVTPERTDRIRHVAHLGVRTRGFAYANRGLPAPTGEVRVELTAPSGETWTSGPDDAPDVVRGSAWDFCLLVTQRAHRSDVDLEATPGAEEWLGIAQAFAGPPGAGREALGG